ncbi:MAG TPA: NosD domain-containing protein, partial [Longimicrobiales bacterium]|nr:NosD domain-containing protein [Longimicrobiales bacterium]
MIHDRRAALAALLTTAGALLLAPSPGIRAQEGIHVHPPADSIHGPLAAPPSRSRGSRAPAAECGPAGPPRTLTVRPGGPYAGLSAALADARAGDTVRVAAGTWEERATVACPVVLLGEEGAVLDGGGEGTVLSVRAPGAVIRGLTIRGSGRTVSTEDAGILAEASAGLRVEGNTLEDVLFGVYLKESPDAVIRANRITGHDLPVADRGDAIRLWYSARGTIEGNVVRRSRDVVIWFSDSVAVRGNDIVGGRYGLHYMYSDHNRFERNRFRDNLVGAFLMYSS